MALSAAQKRFLASWADTWKIWNDAGSPIPVLPKDGYERRTFASLQRLGVLDDDGHLVATEGLMGAKARVVKLDEIAA